MKNEKENIFKRLIKNIKERLSKMERVLTVDRFEGEYAVCEDRDTKEILDIEISKLPDTVKEGSIVRYKNGTYVIDEKLEEETAQRIKDKMDDLWN